MIGIAERVKEGIKKKKSRIAGCGIFYLFSLILVLALKLYYSKADSESLVWILAPTAWWVQILSGIPFERLPGTGFVNHTWQFVIAPACAGLNFMVIALAVLHFCFVHRLKTWKGRLFWIAASIPAVFAYTILVNCLRIVPSIFLLQLDIYNGWITPERLHSLEGTLVYFIFLLVLTLLADKVVTRITTVTVQTNTSLVTFLPPVCVYLGVTLGIPFMNGAFRNNRMNFLEHTLVVMLACSFVLLVFSLVSYFNRKRRKHLRVITKGFSKIPKLSLHRNE